MGKKREKEEKAIQINHVEQVAINSENQTLNFALIICFKISVVLIHIKY